MLRASTGLGLAVIVAGLAYGHSDDPKVNDRFGPYLGTGWKASEGVPMRGGFSSFGEITLESWLTLADLGGADTGNDCWGYVSPSGREYAIIGDSQGTSFVEITDPAAPVILGKISGPNSLWRDVKVFQHHAYIVSEGGDGIQIVNMSNIDLGLVTLVATITTGGTTATHNIAINTDSGFLYRSGGGDNGLRIYDLNASLTNPPYVGMWITKYVHDVQIVTYPDGSPYAGREIAFCCAGFNGGWNETGLSIVDVTDKDNIFVVGELEHSNNHYSHQGWLTEDFQYFYLNDELDEQNTGSATTTRIIDVSNLANPFQAGTCTTGSSAIDHNLYIKGDLMYQSNYRSGLRVFDISNRLNPEEIAWFDTYPSDDSPQFNGIWSNYPFFPSGTVIGSDLERGLFVWTLSTPSVATTVIDPMPEMLNPEGGDSFRIQATMVPGVDIDLSASVLRWDDGSGWQETSMTLETPGNPAVLRATFGPSVCGEMVEFEAIVATDDGFSLSAASGSIISANDIVTTFEDSCETDPGWTVQNDCIDGQWDRGSPVGGGDRGDPPNDADGSGQCWLTDNVDGNSDVDQGTTTLISPILDGSMGNAVLEYYRWFSNNAGAAPNEDIFVVRISDDGGTTWSVLEQVGPTGAESNGGWYLVQFDLASITGIDPTDQIRLAFVAEDALNGSVVEAGVDGIRMTSIDCETCVGDIDGNNVVDVEDILAVIAGYGTEYTVDDVLAVLGAFGSDC
ncbi:MAG: choice-of-anchor B family protein [Phycisphaerales bacterium]|nr:choice-of-anchor B family protein [Phycisphaerales bacterium]